MVVAIIKKAHYNTNPTPVVALGRQPPKDSLMIFLFFTLSLTFIKNKKVIINLKN